MIELGQMMPLLVEACPEFEPIWRRHLEKNAGRAPSVFNELFALAGHLVELADRADTGSFPAVFAAVERLVAEGDTEVREAITVGLIEDLVSLGYPHSADAFARWMGPRTRAAWAELKKLWDSFSGARLRPGRP